jgi:LysM repeat protein
LLTFVIGNYKDVSMKKNIVVLVLLMMMAGFSAKAQDKETGSGEIIAHTVAQGETIIMVSKKYLVTPEDIYKLNPEAVHGIAANTVLRIPADKRIMVKKAAPKAKKTTALKSGYDGAEVHSTASVTAKQSD